MFPTDYAIAPADLGRLAEERGFESLWFPEHTHIPASRETPYPGGGELFLFGVGAGWNREEMLDHGTDPGRRFGVMRERIEAMKAIWTEEKAEYHGRHVDFDPIWSWPKPVQKPHPPVLVGGNGEKVLDRVLAFGDEWMPNRIADEEEFFARVAELQERARAAGRDSVPVTFSGAPAK